MNELMSDGVKQNKRKDRKLAIKASRRYARKASLSTEQCFHPQVRNTSTKATDPI